MMREFFRYIDYDTLATENAALRAERDSLTAKCDEQARRLSFSLNQFQTIVRKDKDSMYERCPDCDCTNTKEQGCQSMPLSSIGDLALAATVLLQLPTQEREARGTMNQQDIADALQSPEATHDD